MTTSKCSLTLHARRSGKAPFVAEQGSVLLVALALLLVMSILGVSAMRGATLEGQLANNSVQKEITFHSAETSTDIILAEDKMLIDNICQPPTVTMTDDANQVNGQTTYSTLEDAGATLPVGFEIGGPIGARRFIVTGSSEIPSTNTRTIIAQGVVMLGAVDPTGGC